MSKIDVVARVSLVSLVVLSFGSVALADVPAPASTSIAFYENPPVVLIPGGGQQDNCADPTVIRGQAGDPYWYAYCTTDSLNDEDVDPSGARRMHIMPMMRSKDLVSWVYMGDSFATRPSWAAPNAGLWAPEITFRNGQYYLYYVVTDVADTVSGEAGCGSDNAIGVATSASPLGPWVDSGGPVVGPRRGGGGCNFFWTYDPDVITTSTGQSYIYYGSYYGGIEARELAADGLTANGTATPITIANRYEGANVVEKDGAYYLFASASNCCNGPLTGYQVFAGKSASPLGPFTDKDGVSLLDGRVGGTPVITQNGNRWVGTGHNSVFQDAGGNWYTAYHAVDRNDPYFEGAVGYTRRPMLLDRLTWNEGWPQVRQGLGPSDTPQLAPLAAAPARPAVTALQRSIYNMFLDGLDPNAYLLALDRVGGDIAQLPLVSASSDEFEGSALDARWSWVRPPAPADFGVADGSFRFATQGGELFGGVNNAAVAIEAAPAGNWVVETKVDLDLPAEGCCFNYVQAGLVVYGSDDAYVKLVHTSIWETRQIEFAKEVLAPAPGYPAYGSGVGAPPAKTTWLRIAKVTVSGTEKYVSYSSIDGVHFERGAVWEHALGAGAKIGLVAFGGTGFNAHFDHVRVYQLPGH
ncbi:MAG: Arabinan endo,5-alpha-L-arabinosidase [Labilithrix sp.]|nr:Arabinan endo,5-alpha-L-arabinosidase [Labilithrix sp.]